MFQYHCLNPIAEKGLGLFDEDYKKTEELEGTDAILVRSAKMHDMELPESVKVIARAGAGVNNIPVKDCAEKGIVVFNTPGANANGVKELVIAGMLLAARDIVGGIHWVQEYEEDGDIAKIAEKKKKAENQPVELVNADKVNINTKSTSEDSPAAKYVKAYSERMSTVNPEFE